MTMRRMLILMIAVIGMFGSDAFAIYAPSTGRFMQRDPIGYKDGMNLYAYVKSSPMNFIDPFGLSITIAIPDDPDGKSDAMRIADSIESLCPNVKVNRGTGEVTYEAPEGGDCDEDTAELCKMLEELINNDKNNVIQIEPLMKALKNSQALYSEGENGENLGSEIQIHPDTKINDKELVFDPATGTWTKNKLDRIKSVESTLAHELGHVLDYNRNGQYPPGSGGYTPNTPGGFPPRESTAIYYENQQRAREGLPQRDFY